MHENGTNENAGTARPVIIVDRRSLRHYLTPLRHLLVGLTTQAYPTMLICPYDADAEAMIGAPVSQIRYPILKVPVLNSWGKASVLDKLRKFKPTVIHCFSARRIGFTRYLARQLNIPYVITADLFHKPLLHTFIFRRQCESVITFSKSVYERLHARHGRLGKLVRLVNPGTFVEDTCACFSQSRHIASLVVSQKLTNPFEFELFLDAVKHLAIDGYEFMVAIIGKGPAERDIHRTIEKLGLSQIVTVVPPMQPLRAIFAGADIFVCLEYTPGLNSRLFDAMSVGMAVAASRENAGDLLVDKKTAVLFDTHDELSIYSNLQKLLGKRELTRQIAKAGQQHLKNHYTVSKMVDSLLEIYLLVQQEHKQKTTTEETIPAES